ncbi:PREDICTED: RING finger protein 150 isoform X1 [Cyprinodon variegatus]|uniref:Ring finger protein 150a n=1 Tax=Cyprinodon variegatus TaxID=28743 RepID=A0A3Q2DR92_CYPVA|nr:PREDICTED: RING finger protein 150 isoform X1 [Cyprinodon variegatus]
MAPSLLRTCCGLIPVTGLLSFWCAQLLHLEPAVGEKEDWFPAAVNITYLDPVSLQVRAESSACGRYGENSPKREVRGRVVVPVPPQDRQGCDPNVRFPPVQNPTWVALLAAGNCSFREKIRNAARNNASGVVIYNRTNHTFSMKHSGTGDIVAIMIPAPKGQELLTLLERRFVVMMHISVGTGNLQKHVSATSVVFVSISFIILMIISLAWLLFYYIQRFRYANSAERNQRHMGDAAEKALSKLQVCTLRKGDKETEADFDSCAVCIECYKANDVVRILPCRHVFHKHCVDPWLQEHRTCPMCKINIFKALGIQFSADCTGETPPDNEASVGGPLTYPISAASEITVNESSVDPAERGINLHQLHHQPEVAPTTQIHTAVSCQNRPPISMTDVDCPLEHDDTRSRDGPC